MCVRSSTPGHEGLAKRPKPHVANVCISGRVTRPSAQLVSQRAPHAAVMFHRKLRNTYHIQLPALHQHQHLSVPVAAGGCRRKYVWDDAPPQSYHTGTATAPTRPGAEPCTAVESRPMHASLARQHHRAELSYPVRTCEPLPRAMVAAKLHSLHRRTLPQLEGTITTISAGSTRPWQHFLGCRLSLPRARWWSTRSTRGHASWGAKRRPCTPRPSGRKAEPAAQRLPPRLR